MAQILNKGLKFIPTPKLPLDEHPLTSYYDEFTRSMRLHYFFGPNQSQTRPPKNPFREKSTWQPPRGSTPLENYLTLTHQALIDHSIEDMKNNITFKQKIAIKKLQDKKYTIKAADKGSGIVIQNTKDYILKGLQHLEDTNIYERLAGDPTPLITTEINKYIEELRNLNLIDQIQFNFLYRTTTPRIQLMYFLTKIHKNPYGIRPIVSWINGPTERISAFIDHYLQPTMTYIDAYLKNSFDLINHLEKIKTNQQTILCTMDVSSLYTNIPQTEGTQACIDLLAELNMLPMPRDYLQHLFNIVLKYNIFNFGENTYKQIHGTAMGTKMAPTYANIFMNSLERKFLRTQTIKPTLYKRYIDDIIIIWDHSQPELQLFIDKYNKFHPTIKFTHTIDFNETIFLDLNISKNSNNKLSFTTHYKSTNRFEYIHYSSAHPTSTKKGILKGELTRINRTTSNTEKRKEITTKITQHFKDRGYPTHNITSQHQITQPQPKNTNTIFNRLLFKTKYFPHINNIRRTLLKHWDIIEKDPTLSLIFPEPPLICYITNKKICNLLTRAKTEGEPSHLSTLPFLLPTPTRIETCNKPGCLKLTNQHRFKTTINLPLDFFNCSSRQIVYAIICTTCTFSSVNYSPHSLRFTCSKHTKAIQLTHKKNTKPYSHFLNTNHNMKILPIIATTTRQAGAYVHYWKRILNL